MSDLLASEFSRLLKSQAFQGALIFCMEFPIFEVVLNYVNNVNNTESQIKSMDGFLNMGFVVFGLLVAVFVSLFIGTDYNDRTIRNKLTAGHSRTAIYMSNFATCVIAVFIMQMVYLITLVVLALTLFQRFQVDTKWTHTHVFETNIMDIIEMQLLGFYILLAYCAIFLLFSMLIPSMSNAVVVCMVLSAVMFVIGMTVPPLAEEVRQKIKIGAEVSGIEPKIYLFLDDFLPSCQADHIKASIVPKRIAIYAMYDSIIVFVTTVLGVILFRKKDFK